ncbi:phosphate transport system protein [Anaerosolibacter carboniphilus]|uniref:Phosphate-specific transport system accessory protein PhoU n=1 Tax=Anaerosolibacter carboniphilus TaxID=1417629 RepID=A0A841KUB4_9FIRM|nr:phosphate signaling complex protein PhoU [Anaerosolibacter carboniphilus]MBB6216987.1 phosphate transport system protein [Anaerosolibacter carboniphilus]
MPRVHLTSELEKLHNDLLKMGSMVEEAILDAIKSLKNQDVILAQKVIDGDKVINTLEEDIEDKCIKLIATQQPMAIDLREICSILRLIVDLERMADHSADIAKTTIRLANEKYVKPLVRIPRMADLAAEMVKHSLDAFVKKDVELAKKTWTLDEEIDALYKDVYNELILIMIEDQDTIPQSTYFLFICKHIERIADYAKNVCEKVVYIQTGDYWMA